MTTQDIGALRPTAKAWPLTWLQSANWPGIVVILALATVWQIISGRLPDFLFPPLQNIFHAAVDILKDPQFLPTVLLTYARIIASVAASFIIGVGFGIAAALSRLVDRAAAPALTLMQGVPAICWIIFAIIWFRDIELRVGFIVVVSTAPSFFFHSRDAVLSISTDLREMVMSWRPTTYQIITKLILPALAPVLLTAILVNLGIATKVGVTAELLAGIGGIGGQLRTAEEQFRMDWAVAWTIPLVLFILLTNGLTALVQKSLLRWRPVVERNA
jgi:NitT/TauT family transport system permease protein